MSAADRRARLEQVRAELNTLLDQGTAPTALLQRLASQDPVALAEVVVGPKAPASPKLVEAALDVIEALEGAIAPKALYQRLVGLSVATRGRVLALAAMRHPLAAWLVKLSETVEGVEAGRTHLAAVAEHPAFAWACQVHAEAGHHRALVQSAASLGRPEPAAALAAEGRLDAAAEAIVRSLESDPGSAVVTWAAAAWGPEAEPLLTAAVRFLRDRDTAQALQPWLAELPSARVALNAVLPALPTR